MKYFPVLVLALTFAPCANADELGRLFFTPQQRTQLERGYAQTASHGSDTSSMLTLNGIVQNANGARTVWVNGKIQNADDSTGQMPDTQTIAAPGKSQPLKIKVGQRLPLQQDSPE